MAMADRQPCTPRSLLKIMWETKVKPRTPPKLSSSTPFSKDLQYAAIGDILREVDCDEVYPGIFVGDEQSARNVNYLKRAGITHVLNTAQGSGIAQVTTNEKYYEPHNIKFLGLKLLDTPQTKISPYFEESAKFIDDALNNNGKVLVHCFIGISRSATIALSYLMLRKGFSAEDAMRTVRQQRDVSPNSGFLQQLCDLDAELEHKRRSAL